VTLFWISFVVGFIRALSRIYSISPRWFQWMLGSLLYQIYWNILKQRRFTVYRNIRIVFPDFSKGEIKEFSKISIKWMAYHFLRFFIVPSLKEKDLKTHFRFHGFEHLEKAKSEGRGVLLLSCHMGNPDLALNGLALAGEKIWVISKKFSVGFSNEIWFRLRSNSNLRYIDAHGKETTYKIFKALGMNESVVFVTDQFMGSPFGIESRFFGKKTGTAYGLARFFLKSKAPIVPCFAVEKEDGICQITFEKPIFAEKEILFRPHENRDQQNLRLVELFNKQVEVMILKDPHHWMWIHRRWKRWKR